MIFGFSFLSVKFAADDIDYIPDNTIYPSGNCPSYLIAECCEQNILSANDA
jgi:hypothetical protein